MNFSIPAFTSVYLVSITIFLFSIIIGLFGLLGLTSGLTVYGYTENQQWKPFPVYVSNLSPPPFSNRYYDKASAILLLIKSPNPNPAVFFDIFYIDGTPYYNNKVNRSYSGYVIPIPVSSTWKTIHCYFLLDIHVSTFKEITPCNVNF